ncbi:hypothetical protein F4818DRAFT_137775 [Hypoxylon cercidicola]|nr:hypothetical protein F4818DRAFT_137775 [Hypoxylon cercidicola]
MATTAVFFQGSIQDGIALALQQKKVVVAFVTDDGDQSRMWENEFVTNDTLRSPLESKALVLRLQAGSKEAGFLEALFPVPKKPTVVIIQFVSSHTSNIGVWDIAAYLFHRNAILKEYIASTTTKEDLIRRVIASLDQVAAPTPAQVQTSSDTHSQTAPQAAPQTAFPSTAYNGGGDTSPAGVYSSQSEPSVQQQVPQPPAEIDAQAQSGAQVQALFLERAKRLEADKKAKEAKEKAEKEARAKQRHEVNENNEGQSPNINAAERSYAEAVRHRKIQAAEERKRILKRIEDDKRERKEREAQERQMRLLMSATRDDGGFTSHVPPVPLSRNQGGRAQGDYCNLQVRLFDGSTLRARFKSDATLANEVRKWIDEERTDDDTPYTFRVLLTPSPNRAIEPTEEIKSLLSLGLTPSSTLVLVRARYAAAYAGADNRSIVWKSYAYIIGIFSAISSFLFGGITGMIFGRRGGERQSAQEDIPLQDLGAHSRIRGFQNPDDRRDAQLYNGNSLNFEPRRDDDEDGGSS